MFIEQVAGAEGELVGEHDGAAMGFHGVLLQLDVAGDVVAGLAVLAALAVHARLHLVQQFHRRDGRIDGNLIHTGKRSQVFGAQALTEDRPARSLVDKVIPRDGDQQHITLLPGPLQVADVAGVHQVKGAVAQHHAPPLGAPLARALGQGFHTGDFLGSHGLILKR